MGDWDGKGNCVGCSAADMMVFCFLHVNLLSVK